ncbi:hypothetical protein BS50DRAFT_94144 [Corynespora cassiicola Philippines]|uniref:Uncharacterized protein n=1 Tax=Corynespora cassiicola Philippines TaxID=1448308 RepID=A0A2T2NF33_CORCC|nr:hypothetical protein BS50DRAFT_94144 [Corynespora cassiicola Philippines]
MMAVLFMNIGDDSRCKMQSVSLFVSWRARSHACVVRLVHVQYNAVMCVRACMRAYVHTYLGTCVTCLPPMHTFFTLPNPMHAHLLLPLPGQHANMCKRPAGRPADLLRGMKQWTSLVRPPAQPGTTLPGRKRRACHRHRRGPRARWMDARQARKLAAGSTLFGCAVPSGPRVCGFDGREAAAAPVAAAAAAAAATETAGFFSNCKRRECIICMEDQWAWTSCSCSFMKANRSLFCWQPWHHGWSDRERVDEVLCLCLQMSWSWSSRACPPASLPASLPAARLGANVGCERVKTR